MLVASWGLLRIPVTEKTFKKLGHFMICELFFHCSAAATFCPWIDLNEKNILIESECCIKSIKCQNCFNQKRLSRDRFYECTLVQMFREHLHWRFCLVKNVDVFEDNFTQRCLISLTVPWTKGIFLLFHAATPKVRLTTSKYLWHFCLMKTKRHSAKYFLILFVPFNFLSSTKQKLVTLPVKLFLLCVQI